MKRIISVLLIIIFGFQTSLKATHIELSDEVRNARSSTLSKGLEKTPPISEELKTSRNWGKQSKLFGLGVGLLIASCIAESFNINDNISQLILMATTYCFVTSFVNLGRYFFEWYGESVAKAEYGLKQKASQKGKTTPKQAEKLEQAVQNNIRLTRTLFRQSQNLINASLKISALYVIFQNDDFNASLENIAFISLISGGFIYNINEIKHTYTSGKVRNDIPLLGILNGVCEALIAANLFNYWQNRGLEIAPGFSLPIRMPLTSSQWAFYRFLQVHGDLESIGNALQLPLNIVSGIQSYFKKSPQIIEENKQEAATKFMPSSQQSEPLSFSRTQFPSTEHKLNDQSFIVDPNTHFAPSTTKKINRHEPKVKIKTKGTPSLSLPTTTPTPLEEREDILSEKDTIRQKALAHIQELRQETTIKEATINQEIRQLLAFLTNARLEKVGHGKQAIIINFKDNKSFRIIFEAPHEQSNASSDEYKGYRKTRVLDALQVGYLYGWNEAKILQFMNINNINRFYNIPLFLIHILWERGQYQ